MGIGVIIGAGIFVLTGHAAARIAGPAIVISFILAGVACAFAGLCYAELASMIPVAGSAYTYAYATLGQFIAWIVGWDLILEYTLGATTVSIGWSGYFASLIKDLGVHIPQAFVSPPIDYTVENGWFATGAILNLPAVVIVAIITVILILGIKESATVNAVVVFVKVAIILAFISVGAFAASAVLQPHFDRAASSSIHVIRRYIYHRSPSYAYKPNLTSRTLSNCSYLH